MRKIAAALCVVLTLCCIGPRETLAAEKESAYDRVMRTGVLRCGYIVWPPFFVKDPNTQAKSGIYYEILEETARQLGLKVEWKEEVSPDGMFEGFKIGRYDAVCGPLVPTPGRAREADFAMELGFTGFFAYTRRDEKRFSDGLSSIDAPGTRIVCQDGEMSCTMAEEEFPSAQVVSIPHIGDGAVLLMHVDAGKSDVVITDPVVANRFMKNNPGRIRVVDARPVRVVPVSMMAIPVGEDRLRRMLDLAFSSLHHSGFIERAIRKDSEYSKTILRRAPGYEAPK